MKVIVVRDNLKEGLGIISGASGENLNLPILKYALFDISDNRIKLTATNLEIAASFLVSGKIIEKGSATIPLGIFQNLINNIQSERLNIEKNKNGVEIKTDNYQALIQGLPPGDFPIIPKISDENKNEFIEIDSGIFKEALRQVVVGTQFSDLRPELNSVFFDFSIESIKLVATDSFRLAEKTIPGSQFKANHKNTFKLLVPLKTSQELLRILKEGEVLRIYHDPNQILFKTENLEFISRLVDGNFPDYTAVIPRKLDSEIVVSREELISALKLTGIFGSRFGEIKIRVPEAKKTIEIWSADEMVGENHYFLTAKVRGKTKEASFNWRHLLDGLKAIKGEEVFLGLNSEDNKPALLKTPSDVFYLYILMPILKT